MLKLKKLFPIVATAAVIAVSSSSCNGDDDAPGYENPRGEIELTGNEKSLVDGQNQFAFRLLNQIITQENLGRNVIVSPVSVACCLGMVASGAEGNTLDEITGLLGAESAQELSEFHGKLADRLPALDRKTAINPANSLWVDTDFSIKDNFRNKFNRYYGDNLFSLDLYDDSAVGEVNGWCAKQTHNLIDRILTDSPDVNMLLINSLYFDGKWADEFDKEMTRSHTFHNADRSESTVKMMQGIKTVEYSETESAKTVRLPYGNGAYSMVIIMPAEDADFALITGDIYKSLTAKESMPMQRILIGIPRLDVTDENMLRNPLVSLGLSNLFSAEANLSAITDGALSVDRIMHKCRVIADESGTKAAAVTATGTDSVTLPEHKMTVDRPFTFVIEEQSTGLILFMGKIDKL